jgi:hypothetical protein
MSRALVGVFLLSLSIAFVPVAGLVAAPVVSNTGDNGLGSLRQAIADAINGDTITFSIPPASTILLTTGELVIDKNITIAGPGANLLKVERDPAAPSSFRIFHIAPGKTVTIQGITISKGTGPQFSSFGCGIYNDQSNLTVNACTITAADCGIGGGIYNNGSPASAILNVNNSTFSANRASTQGAAINNNGSSSGNATLRINNSTFSDNRVFSFGLGCVYNDASSFGIATAQIANSTFKEGTFTVNIINLGQNGGHATLEIGNTILEKISPSVQNVVNTEGTVISRGYNIANGSAAGLTHLTDQPNVEAMLGPLKDNGGPTLTHAPLLNSPALDYGKRDTIPALATNFDQRGSSRPVDDPAVNHFGDESDVGAVEVAIGVHPMTIRSSKTHGAAGDFAIDIPLGGTGAVEPRSGGPNNDYQLILTFSSPVTLSGAAMTEGIGSLVNVFGSGTNTLTANLTGVTNAQRITVALFDVNDGTHSGDIGVRLGVLVGDVDRNSSVNSTDIGATKSRSGVAITTANCTRDVIANGVINATDIAVVKIQSGTGFPPFPP